MSWKGRFITLEGIEGCGKSTLAKGLVEQLEADGHQILLTREPGGTPVGDQLRELLMHSSDSDGITPEAEMFLFAASRSELVRRVIMPALEAGSVVICDRFVDSSIAYQGYARLLGAEDVIAVNRSAIGPAVPDISLLFDLDVEVGMDRISGRANDRIERETAEFHGRVRDGYLQLAQRWPERFCVLDASAAPETVLENALSKVREVIDGSISGSNRLV